MSLPDVSSFYVKSVKPTQERVYGTRTVRFMLSRMVSATSSRLMHLCDGVFSSGCCGST